MISKLIPPASNASLWEISARLNMKSTEGGAQDKEYRAKYSADRIRTTAGTWMGATMGCAQCHDHKFDPFTTKDFYRFGAFFADIKHKGYYANAQGTGWGETVTVPNPEFAPQIAALEKQRQALEKRLSTATRRTSRVRTSLM